MDRNTRGSSNLAIIQHINRTHTAFSRLVVMETFTTRGIMNSIICLCSSCHLVSVLSALHNRSIYYFSKPIYGTMSFLISVESIGCKFEFLDCFT